MSIAQNAVQLKKQNKLLTVICADPSDVIRLQDEVTWFDPSLKLTVFPDWETLPYDVLSPHSDLVGERLQTLYLLLNRQKRRDPVDVLIVSASTATQRLAPRNYIGSTTFFFRKGDRIDPTDLRAELVARAMNTFHKWSLQESLPAAADCLTSSRWAQLSLIASTFLMTNSMKSEYLIRITNAL